MRRTQVTSNTAVQIRDLTKTIGKKTIVDSLSFDIPKGEVFGLLGPNGAGKTTTIRMMVGLISITRGDVHIAGHDVRHNFKAAMTHVGAIVENPEMYKFLTGFQNLKHYANMSQGVTKQRIMEVVRQVGMDDRIHDKVKTYSLGMRALAITISLLAFVVGRVLVQALLGYHWVKYILFANTDLSQFVVNGPEVKGLTLGFSLTMIIAYFVVMNLLAWLFFVRRDVAYT
jgi:ABC-type transport system involved in cytochrome c biogenesis ATPase subunit